MLSFAYCCYSFVSAFLIQIVYYYQNKRGGKVKLQSILMPLSEFDHAEKGDALYGELKLLELDLWLVW